MRGHGDANGSSCPGVWRHLAQWCICLLYTSWKLNIDDVDFARFSQAKLLSLASIFNSPLLDDRALTEIFTQAKARQMIICADMIKPRLNETDVYKRQFLPLTIR